MTDYIPTRIDGGLNPEFNSKKELDKLLKKKSYSGFSKQEAGGILNLTPKMLIAYEKEFVVTRVDDRTGRVYRFDTRTQKEYLSTEKHKGALGTTNVKVMHPALQYHYEKNNIPLPGEKGDLNLNDIKFLEARIRYENALSYKNKGNVKSRGLGLNTYNDRVNSDKKNNRFLEDGVTTVYEASYDGKLNALELEMTNAYENSSYWNNDLSFKDTQVKSKIETETKENEEKNKKVEVPVQRDQRYINMMKVQKELDETINKGENLKNRGVLNIGPKSVKTYDLRNLLQIEQ